MEPPRLQSSPAECRHSGGRYLEARVQYSEAGCTRPKCLTHPTPSSVSLNRRATLFRGGFLLGGRQLRRRREPRVEPAVPGGLNEVGECSVNSPTRTSGSTLLKCGNVQNRSREQERLRERERFGRCGHVLNWMRTASGLSADAVETECAPGRDAVRTPSNEGAHTVGLRCGRDRAGVRIGARPSADRDGGAAARRAVPTERAQSFFLRLSPAFAGAGPRTFSSQARSCC